MISEFLSKEPLAVLGAMHNNYHGDALTTTDEAWMGEIEVMQQVLEPWKEEQGVVICVPYGNSNKTPEGFPEDPTRLPEFYDGTYDYLKSLGLEDL